MIYMVIGSDKVQDLESEVQKAIEEGYKPQGGIAVTMYREDRDDECYYDYHQAMVKEESGIGCLINERDMTNATPEELWRGSKKTVKEDPKVPLTSLNVRSVYKFGLQHGSRRASLRFAADGNLDRLLNGEAERSEKQLKEELKALGFDE